MNETSNGYGKRIRQQRILLGMSQVDLARKAGVSPGYLCAVENTDIIPSVPVRRSIALALAKQAPKSVSDAKDSVIADKPNTEITLNIGSAHDIRTAFEYLDKADEIFGALGINATHRISITQRGDIK